MANNGKRARRYPKLVLGETISVALETFRSNKVRFALTALGMVIGTASLILVVTIGLTGKQYVCSRSSPSEPTLFLPSIRAAPSTAPRLAMIT